MNSQLFLVLYFTQRWHAQSISRCTIPLLNWLCRSRRGSCANIAPADLRITCWLAERLVGSCGARCDSWPGTTRGRNRVRLLKDRRRSHEGRSNSVRLTDRRRAGAVGRQSASSRMPRIVSFAIRCSSHCRHNRGQWSRLRGARQTSCRHFKAQGTQFHRHEHSRSPLHRGLRVRRGDPRPRRPATNTTTCRRPNGQGHIFARRRPSLAADACGQGYRDERGETHGAGAPTPKQPFAHEKRGVSLPHIPSRWNGLEVDEAAQHPQPLTHEADKRPGDDCNVRREAQRVTASDTQGTGNTRTRYTDLRKSRSPLTTPSPPLAMRH